MNFLLHRHFALRDLGSEDAGVGAMMPDFWRMVEGKARAHAPTEPIGAQDDQLFHGVLHHLDADGWFHRAEAFRDGEKILARRFLALRPKVPKLVLFAHIAWELCLDGALIRAFPATPTNTAKAVLAVGDHRIGAALRVFTRIDATTAAELLRRLTMLRARLINAEWLAGYADSHRLAQRIDGVRSRLGLQPLEPSQLSSMAEVFADVTPLADQALKTLLWCPPVD